MSKGIRLLFCGLIIVGLLVVLIMLCAGPVKAAMTVTGIGYTGGYIKLDQPTTVNLSHTSGKVTIGDCFSSSCTLQPGTWFVRDENAANFTMTGATMLTTATDTNALDASDTWIKNGRQGAGSLGGFTPGQSVSLTFKRLNFDIGVGTGLGELNNSADAKIIAQIANTISARGDALWGHMEPKQGKPDTSGIDGFYSWAQSHGMHTRLHRVMGAYSEPTWEQNLLKSGNATKVAAAVAAREAYLFKGKTWNEVDVYNEANGDTGDYNKVFGIKGVATVYNAVPAGSQTMLNNGDLLGGYDIKSYVQYAQQLIAAGGRVDALGIEDYNDSPGDVVTPSSFMQNIQTLNVLGRPQEITEYGDFNTKNQDVRLNNAMRMMFGNPLGEGFISWEWIKASDNYTPSGLYDTKLKITPSGVAWLALFNAWKTPNQTLIADANGVVHWNGYYGDYTIGGKAYTFTKPLAASPVVAAVPEPASLWIAGIAGMCLILAGILKMNGKT